jgi:enamine deaminase RidA (YjgF/YER057c/UK114 family)
MQYLAVQIEHANTRLGKAGKFETFYRCSLLGQVVKVFFTGAEHIDDSMNELKRVMDNYSRELQNTHANLTVEVWRKVRGTLLKQIVALIG